MAYKNGRVLIHTSYTTYTLYRKCRRPSDEVRRIRRLLWGKPAPGGFVGLIRSDGSTVLLRPASIRTITITGGVLSKGDQFKTS